jgi:hypothetical protein
MQKGLGVIRHLVHGEIEKARWDDCIEHSTNRMPYALSWWLDAVCPHWEALVMDDYLAVMPLTRNRKMGIHYLYQPFFTQQLGVFCTGECRSDTVDQFLESIPRHFRYIEIQMNSRNHPCQPVFRYSSRKNCTLSLSPSYLNLAANYHRNCRRNIQKALQEGLSVRSGPPPSVFTRFIHRNLHDRLSIKGKTFYRVLQRITSATLHNGSGEILGVYDHNGSLLAAGWFVQAAGRYTFLVCASTPKGKTRQAMFLLVDHAIRKKAGSELIFDFAGSNHPGIQYFNLGFGAEADVYTAVKRNILSWPFRLLKP